MTWMPYYVAITKVEFQTIKQNLHKQLLDPLHFCPVVGEMHSI